ncbi:serine/threonine kinase 16 [Talaromyces proteolyticus]|uniref:Serine/threonine kinase 16 n=1 Tax=Talaromyces proteolyticus TaxID=1131652 RepID=A0AAD4L4J2_9EURO|nr:serine/threonine kinase 16 [Talaromyces proteolyticus]KAH8703437.1 serine/threonine kinase 16 [Talaromyces proteolyticus]
MPFGILECDAVENVPGTAIVSDQDDLPPEYSLVPRDQLKHGKGRFSSVILVPQPSDDPNDPLNWPQWRKESVLLIIGLAAGVAGSYGPMLSPGFVEIAKELGISVSQLAQATAWMILTIGLSLFVLNPLAKVYGRRPIYIFSIVMLFISSVVGGTANEFHMFEASRIIGAFGLAPFELLVQCTIGDLYFVHERGTRIAFWNMCLLCGINAGALISGYVIENLGWKWCFWICAILYGVLLLLIVFFVPETCYNRESSIVVRAMVDEAKGDHIAAMHLETKQNKIRKKASEFEQSTSDSSINGIQRKMSYWHSLHLYSGRYSNASLFKVAARPFILFWYPAVFVLFAVFGVMMCWSVVYSNVIGVIFVAPPYNFSVSQAGLTSLSPLILAIIGEVVSGPLNDAICLYLTRKNKGIYEPEFRLVLIVVVIILSTVGFFGFGATVHYQTHWTGPVLTYGLSNMALAFTSTCLYGYVLDCYPTLNAEAFVALNLRNILAFGMSYVIEDWLVNSGVLNVFVVLGSIILATCSLTVPLWIFGKKCRSWTGRNKWLTEFMSDYD